VTQPSVYSRASVIDAAFELIREKGWASVSTRSVARKLGSSTMPIYSHVKSVAELEKELRMKARDLLLGFQQRPYTADALLNLAMGYVIFARDERHLFRFLFLEKPEPIPLEELAGMRGSLTDQFGEDIAGGDALTGLSVRGQEALVRYSWIFTHGLAVLVNSGAFGSLSDDTLVEFLTDSGEAFYLWAERTTS